MFGSIFNIDKLKFCILETFFSLAATRIKKNDKLFYSPFYVFGYYIFFLSQKHASQDNVMNVCDRINQK